MESTIMLQPGTYYVGDLGFVLPNDDLRHLFAWKRDNSLENGYKLVEESAKTSFHEKYDMYWITSTPHKQGTVYDEQGNGWGIDWGCFGALPWKWVTCSGAYNNNKIEFTEPFSCSSTDDSITIGHLHFTFNPK
jgi:hypothetical protein